MATDELKRRTEQRLTYQDYDDNNRRLAYVAGNWAAGSYRREMQVYHQGVIWRCVAALGTTTTQEPQQSATDWFPASLAGGIGGMSLQLSEAGADLGAAWQPFDHYDTANPLNYGATVDPNTGQFSFDFRGTWDVSFLLFFSHTEAQGGREFQIRLFNVTEGTPAGPGITFGIARNQPTTNATATLRAGISDTELNDQLRLEIGAGDTIGGIVYETVSLNLLQVHAHYQ